MLGLKLIHVTEGGPLEGEYHPSTAYWPQFIPDYWFCWIIIHVSPIKNIVISRIGNGHSATHPKLSGPDCIKEESCLLLCFIFPSPPLGDDSWSLLHEVRTIPPGLPSLVADRGGYHPHLLLCEFTCIWSLFLTMHQSRISMAVVIVCFNVLLANGITPEHISWNLLWDQRSQTNLILHEWNKKTTYGSNQR